MNKRLDVANSYPALLLPIPKLPKIQKKSPKKNFLFIRHTKKTQNNKQSKKPKQELNEPYSVNYHE